MAVITVTRESDTTDAQYVVLTQKNNAGTQVVSGADAPEISIDGNKTTPPVVSFKESQPINKKEVKNNPAIINILFMYIYPPFRIYSASPLFPRTYRPHKIIKKVTNDFAICINYIIFEFSLKRYLYLF